MRRDDVEDAGLYYVVMNHDEQYSVWPAEQELPAGWRPLGNAAKRQECLSLIREVWTDMRPRALRRQMEADERYQVARDSASLRIGMTDQRGDPAEDDRRVAVACSQGSARLAADVVDGRPTSCIHDLILHQARERPDVCALQWNERSLSYRELDQSSSLIARKLAHCGVGPERIVALCGRRSPDLVAAMLAVLRTGGGYVHIDSHAPAERVGHIIASANVRIVLTTDDVDDIPGGQGVRRIRVSDARRLGTTLPPDVEQRVFLDGVATVIYTSGTSGRPKGVMLSHRAIATRFVSQKPARGATPGCQRSSFGLVGHVADLLLSLAAGRSVVILDDDVIRQPVAFARKIRQCGITIVGMVPSQLHAVLENDQVVQLLSQVEEVIVSGEALSPRVAAMFKNRLPNATLTNSYGMSETAGAVATASIIDHENIVIGAPIPLVDMYVLGPSMLPVAPGSLGELYVRGVQLSRGYLGQPDLTAETFVPDPFGPPGSRMLRTGDIARVVGSGALALSGRADDEVQVRGHRVNIVEVEAVLEAAPGVTRAAVVYDETNGVDGRLRAFVVLGEPADRSRYSAVVRNYMYSRVPEYMIPVSFHNVEALPLLPSRKIDRAQVARMSRQVSLDGHVALDRHDIRAQMEEIWSDVLGTPTADGNAALFELGGESLAVMRILTRIMDRFGVELTLEDLCERATMEEIASVIRRRLDESGAPKTRGLGVLSHLRRRLQFPL